MRQYQDLIRHVLKHGTRKENRTGVDTISTFGYYYEHDMLRGFPLLTTKKMSWKNIVIELLWFLSGSNRSGFLDRHKCGFWKPWYNEATFAEKFAADDKGVTVNAAYGPAWRRFEYPAYYESDSGLSHMDGPCTGYFDQIDWAVRRLREKPMDRAIVISAWQPHIATKPPSANAYWAPCHCMWILNVQNDDPSQRRVCYGHNDPAAPDPVCGGKGGYRMVRELPPGYQWCSHCQKILQGIHGEKAFANPPAPTDLRKLCLHLTQRSCDTALGVPYNLASYSLLLHIMARLAGIEPGIFGHTLVDAHIYTAKPDGSQAEFDHVPGLKEQIERETYGLPKLIIADDIRELADIERLLHPSVTTDEIMGKFLLEDYQYHPSIPFKVAV